MTTFSLSVDPKALAEIAQFAGFGTLLSEEVQQAMDEAGSLLVASAQGNMHWQHPSGALEESIHVMNESPYEIEVGSDLPYARRREKGFSGMTDSLGRTFHNDPGQPYLAPALAENQSAILASIDEAVERALDRLVQG